MNFSEIFIKDVNDFVMRKLASTDKSASPTDMVGNASASAAGMHPITVSPTMPNNNPFSTPLTTSFGATGSRDVFGDTFKKDVGNKVKKKLAAAAVGRGSSGGAKSNSAAPAGGKSTAPAAPKSTPNMAAPTNAIIPQVDATNLGGGMSVKQNPISNQTTMTNPQTVTPAAPKFAALKQTGPFPVTTRPFLKSTDDTTPAVPNTAPNSKAMVQPIPDLGSQVPARIPWSHGKGA